MSGSESESPENTARRKLRALVRVARYKPWKMAAIALLNIGAAGLEAIGLSFILPIVELADGGTSRPRRRTD